VAVGENWLRVRTTRSDHWVQTDQLVKAEVWFNWATRKLILEDRDGRRLIVDLADLNPVMLEAFRAAMRRSQAAGLRLNRVTEPRFNEAEAIATLIGGWLLIVWAGRPQSVAVGRGLAVAAFRQARPVGEDRRARQGRVLGNWPGAS
jgi:hypothetical protein